MALSTFPNDMNAAAATVLNVAARFRAIRDGSGDLSWSDLEAAQNGLRRAKLANIAVITHLATLAQTNSDRLAVAENYMASLGGPATLSAFEGALMVVEQAASAWNDALPAFLATLGSRAFVATQDAGQPTETRHIAWSPVIPETEASALRQSAELAALITAFGAVGA